MHLVENISYKFRQPVSIAPLITFRIIFGAIMIFNTLRFISLGWIEEHYLTTKFQFKYFGFSWVRVLSSEWMYGLYVIMLLAAIGVMLGLYYRLSALMLFLTFTYTELIDLTYYLNHYYFVTVILGMLMFLPAHKHFSLDVLRKPNINCEVIPSWFINVLKLQLIIVYVYAGLAKINSFWLLDALPMKIWMPAGDQIPLLGSILSIPVIAYVFSWAGMIYDCTIAFFLLSKRTRGVAYITVILFHAMTSLMFQIGIFPLVMIGATLIFFSGDWHVQFLSRLKRFLPEFNIGNKEKSTAFIENRNTATNYALVSVFCIHILFQLIFPWRYLLYPGNLFWTEEGYRFSWRVMLVEKAGTATFYVKDSATGREGVVINSEFLNSTQESQMSYQPDMILQFAHFLKTYYQEQGVVDPEVRAEVYVTMNARPSLLLIDPTVDLIKIEDGWKYKEWINPYQQ